MSWKVSQGADRLGASVLVVISLGGEERLAN